MFSLSSHISMWWLLWVILHNIFNINTTLKVSMWSYKPPIHHWYPMSCYCLGSVCWSQHQSISDLSHFDSRGLVESLVEPLQHLLDRPSLYCGSQHQSKSDLSHFDSRGLVEGLVEPLHNPLERPSLYCCLTVLLPHIM